MESEGQSPAGDDHRLLDVTGAHRSRHDSAGLLAEPDTAGLPRTYVHVVTRLEVIRFAAAISATDPVHHDLSAARRSGYRDILAPPHFYCTLGTAMGSSYRGDEVRTDGLPWNVGTSTRIVAGESRVQWLGDICAGDEVVCREELETARSTTNKRGEPMTVHTYRRAFSVGTQPVVIEQYSRLLL